MTSLQWITDRYATGSTSIGGAALAFIVVPVLSSLFIVTGVVLLFLATFPAGDNPPDAFQMIVTLGIAVVYGAMLVGAPFTYAGMLLIGFPVWLLLRYTNNESGIAYTLMGAAGGWFLGPALGGHKWESSPLHLVGAAGGALTASLFWWVARRRPGPVSSV